LSENPRDPFVAYNVACAQAMTGEHAAAAETLIDAVAFGFSDLFHMANDPHLDPIREEPSYAALIRGWRRVLDARGEADLKGARESLGPTYAYESDGALRLNFASAMTPESFAAARREISRTSIWASTALGLVGATDEARPDPWVLVILPTPKDFAKMIGSEGIGGYYDKDRKRLVSQDIGPTLRHEFFHVLHWRHMDRLGQRHPYWIMEGLAALLEDVEADGEGYRLAPSWRTNIVKRLGRSGRLTKWKDLFTMDREAFMGPRARANYAQARAVLMFLHERGRLARWYRAYVEGFNQDSTGAAAIEAAMDQPLTATEREFKTWLDGIPFAGEQNRPGAAGLGVALGPGSGDGPVVSGIVAASRAIGLGDERLRMRDVITAVNGRATRSLDEFHRILAEFEVGDEVRLEVRRGSRTLVVTMRLVPITAPEP
ncbi:MAG: PDZ domain-containing protein, partial [Phycisphaerae bacterium]|nr:PDZ domain-containing protein [Phycisphaerae bacterium]